VAKSGRTSHVLDDGGVGSADADVGCSASVGAASCSQFCSQVVALLVVGGSLESQKRVRSQETILTRTVGSSVGHSGGSYHAPLHFQDHVSGYCCEGSCHSRLDLGNQKVFLVGSAA